MKLTQTVQKGGCAAKVPAAILREVLAGVRFPPLIPGVAIDGTLFDDAAIFNLSPELSLVQTLDFFTPILDDPYDFGAVAAANALSDVYAMGGVPKTALAILAAPLAVLDTRVIQAVLQGASDKIAEAKASLVGGHSIDDDTLKFGLSVTGTVHPEGVWSNAGAKPGDVLILTKPLGTGTLCAGLKRGAYTQDQIAEAVASMKRLNNVCDVADTSAVSAGTDVTGFGLAGHAVQLARASRVQLVFDFKALPHFEQVWASLAQGHLTKAHRSNREYTMMELTTSGLSTAQEQLLFDPQTSGGLLLSVAASQAQALLGALQVGFPAARVVGEVHTGAGVHVAG